MAAPGLRLAGALGQGVWLERQWGRHEAVAQEFQPDQERASPPAGPPAQSLRLQIQ